MKFKSTFNFFSEKVLMGQMGDDHQQYLFGLVDLLATCAEVSFTLSKFQHLYSGS